MLLIQWVLTKCWKKSLKSKEHLPFGCKNVTKWNRTAKIWRIIKSMITSLISTKNLHEFNTKITKF